MSGYSKSDGCQPLSRVFGNGEIGLAANVLL